MTNSRGFYLDAIASRYLPYFHVIFTHTYSFIGDFYIQYSQWFINKTCEEYGNILNRFVCVLLIQLKYGIRYNWKWTVCQQKHSTFVICSDIYMYNKKNPLGFSCLYTLNFCWEVHYITFCLYSSIYNTKNTLNISKSVCKRNAVKSRKSTKLEWMCECHKGQTGLLLVIHNFTCVNFWKAFFFIHDALMCFLFRATHFTAKR